MITKNGRSALNVISGACLCGKITFELENKFGKFYLCHCEQCQKITGSSHASNLFGDPEHFHFTSGEENVERFDHPSRNFTRAFCNKCGSGIPYLSANEVEIVVPAGSLNSMPIFDKKIRIFYAERPTWHRDDKRVEIYDAFPV